MAPENDNRGHSGDIADNDIEKLIEGLNSHKEGKFDSVRRVLLSEEECCAHQQGLRLLAGHREIATSTSK
jgi:hypothetical protein